MRRRDRELQELRERIHALELQIEIMGVATEEKIILARMCEGLSFMVQVWTRLVVVSDMPSDQKHTAFKYMSRLRGEWRRARDYLLPD